MLKWVLIWAAVSIGSAIIGGLLAASKRRDHSFWAAWCFLLPPMLLILLLLPKNLGPRPRQPSLDELDQGAD